MKLTFDKESLTELVLLLENNKKLENEIEYLQFELQEYIELTRKEK